MLGIVYALGASFSWTYACFLWRQQTREFSSLQINLIKNLIAFLIFFPILLSVKFESNYVNISILLLSGILGIAIGDSFYISALKKIGTRKTLSVEALSPLLANILGSIILNETLSYKAWVGVFVVSLSLLGIATSSINYKETFMFKNQSVKGFIYAFISVLMAVGAAILSRWVLLNSTLNPFETTEIRLLGSLLILCPYVRLDLKQIIKDLPLKKKFKMIFATLIGTNIGILFQQNVFYSLPIGLGWTLLSTSPAFALIFSKYEEENLDMKSILLTFSTILGVAISFL